MPISTINAASISGLGYGFKNRIINGSMAVWQRGTSGFADNTYCADRWLGLNITTVAQSSDTPSAAFPFSVDFANSGVSFPLVLQRIEAVNAQDLVGQQVTLSFWAKNVSGSATLYCELNYPNAKDNFSATTAIQSRTASASPPSSWTFYTLTFNALPSQVANGLEVRIVRNNASASQTRVTGVQLEAGVKATNFDYRPYGLELALCQRYFYRNGGSIAYQSHSIGVFTASNQVDGPFWFPVPFRATPSLTVNNLASFYSAGGGTPSSIVLQDAPSTNNNQLMLRWVVPTAFAVGNAARLYSNGNAAATLDFSAEL